MLGLSVSWRALRVQARDCCVFGGTTAISEVRSSDMRIGIAGTGKMGAAIADRLRETGAEVIAWNRSPQKAQTLGLPVAATPLELASQSDVIISSLFDAA